MAAEPVFDFSLLEPPEDMSYSVTDETGAWVEIAVSPSFRRSVLDWCPELDDLTLEELKIWLTTNHR